MMRKAGSFELGRDTGMELDAKIREQFDLGAEEPSIRNRFLLKEDLGGLLESNNRTMRG